MVKQNYILIGLVIIFLATGIFLATRTQDKIASSPLNTPTTIENRVETKPIFVSPISDPLARITKKSFGIYVSPKNSPVSPEKFTGYHTGVDFEVFPTEQNQDIAISTICDGKILEKQQARGYGGMIVQSCSLDNKPITVVYGHIKLSSVSVAIGDDHSAGSFLAFLGQGYSTETDGERKHLHLGIHKGIIPDTRGYVQTENELNKWIDIQDYLK